MKRFSIWIAAVLMAVFWACGLQNQAGNDNGGVQDVQGVQDTSTVQHPQFYALYQAYFNTCARCHAPGAMGRTPDIEKSLDFSTADTAYATLKGRAQGLTGNVQACNNTPFIGQTYETSLLAAVLDGTVRAKFNAGSCTSDEVTDMTVKGGQPPAHFLENLKKWIDAGAP